MQIFNATKWQIENLQVENTIISQTFLQVYEFKFYINNV